MAFRPDHGDKQIAFSHKPFHYSQTRVDIQKATAAVDSYSDNAVIISLINYNLLLLFILFHVVFCALSSIIAMAFAEFNTPFVVIGKTSLSFAVFNIVFRAILLSKIAVF